MRTRAISRFLEETSGASALEFAITLPLMLLILVGGYVISEAVMIGRKVTITTRALADLTTQYPSVAPTDIATIMNASQQILAPFNTTTLSMRLSEIKTDSLLGLTATVQWSKSVNTTAYSAGSSYTLPVAMSIPNTAYILSEVTYTYNPAPVYNAMGPYPISGQILMLPRVSADVPCASC